MPNPYEPTTWGTSQLEDLTVPSGQLCQVRKTSLEVLIELNILQDLDTLSKVVNDQHITRVKGKSGTSKKSSASNTNSSTNNEAVDFDVEALMRDDPKTFMRMIHMVNRVVEYIVVQPEVEWPVKKDEAGEPLKNENGTPIELPAEERRDGVVYTDAVDLNDRFALFSYLIGGSKQLEQFRETVNESA